MIRKKVTTINDASQADTSKLKTNYEKSQEITTAFSNNYTQLDDLQPQVEKTVTRRFELFCKIYLEQIKFLERYTKSSKDLQQNSLAKLGLKIDTQPEFQKMMDIWNNSLRNWYANQARYSEMVLNTLHQNMRMTNMNMDEFSKMVWSNLSWWIPPNQK